VRRRVAVAADRPTGGPTSCGIDALWVFCCPVPSDSALLGASHPRGPTEWPVGTPGDNLIPTRRLHRRLLGHGGVEPTNWLRAGRPG
jgi:hypothetical protein